MAIPNLSNSLYVAKLRYIQAIHEAGERKNPDTLVKHFIPVLERLRYTWIGESDMAKLRADPFYYYLVARTKYYDQVFRDAILAGARQIIGVGCGSDTRAYRFEDLLRANDVQVLECDQAESIEAKQRVAKRWRTATYVQHLPIDLNDGSWPELERRLQGWRDVPALVMMEGVSPYVDTRPFGDFLSLLADRLRPGSLVAYDFKLVGVKDDFGQEGRTERPFRLTSSAAEVQAFHERHGFIMDACLLSSELGARELPAVNGAANTFDEDCLVRLRVRGS